MANQVVTLDLARIEKMSEDLPDENLLFMAALLKTVVEEMLPPGQVAQDLAKLNLPEADRAELIFFCQLLATWLQRATWDSERPGFLRVELIEEEETDGN